jgi:hypothetical protein
LPQALPIAASFIASNLAAVGVSTAFAKAAGVFIVNMAVNVAVSVAATALMRPDVDRAGSPTTWQADPNAGIPFAMGGRQAVGGRIVFKHEFSSSIENMYLGIVTVWSGAGPVKGLEDFLVMGEAQAFNGSQQNTGVYGDKMFFSYQLGEQPEAAALASPTILRSGETIASVGWTTGHKLSGKAADMLTLGHDDVGDVFPGGSEPETTRLLEGGIALYDPRNDTTQTAIGGAGDERWDDRDTWGYPDNPIIGALNWALGLQENGKRVGGMGIPMDALLLDQFADAANIADLNGWTFAAYPTTVDDKWQVFLALLQAGGAVPCTVNGKLGCWSRAAVKTSLLTVTEDDLAGPIELNLSTSRLDRINTIIPSCRLESAQWDMAALAEPILFADLIEEDGGPRSREVRYNYVTDPDQCAELASLDILDGREAISGVIPCKPYLRDLRAGDAFTLDLDVRGLEGLKCVVLRRPEFDVEQGICRIAFRSETDSKYTLALGATGVEPDPIDPVEPPVIPTPDVADWDATPAASGGFDVTGAPALPVASRVRIEYRLDGDTDWLLGSEGPATQGRFPVSGMAAGDYEVAVSYYNIAGSGPGPRLVLGPITVTVPAAEADLTDLLDGTTSFTGLNANGTDVITFLGMTDGSALDDVDGVTEDLLTPAFSAFTAAAVSWTASSAEQDLQEVTVSVVRGRVSITAQADIGAISTASGWQGRFRLYRDATELTDAERKIRTIQTPGPAYDLPSQITLAFLDEPGAGTYDYRVTFTPGASLTADITNRSLLCVVGEG